MSTIPINSSVRSRVGLDRTLVVAVHAVWGFGEEEALQRVRVKRATIHGFVTLEEQDGFGLPLDRDESFELLLDAGGRAGGADLSEGGRLPAQSVPASAAPGASRSLCT